MRLSPGSVGNRVPISHCKVLVAFDCRQYSLPSLLSLADAYLHHLSLLTHPSFIVLFSVSAEYADSSDAYREFLNLIGTKVEVTKHDGFLADFDTTDSPLSSPSRLSFQI